MGGRLVKRTRTSWVKCKKRGLGAALGRAKKVGGEKRGSDKEQALFRNRIVKSSKEGGRWEGVPKNPREGR